MIRTSLFKHGAFNRFRSRRPTPLALFDFETGIFNEFMLNLRISLPTYPEYLAARRARFLHEVGTDVD